MDNNLMNKAWNVIQGIPGDITGGINDWLHSSTTYTDMKPQTQQQIPQPTASPAQIFNKPTPNAIQALPVSNDASRPDKSNINWLEQNVLPITRKAGFPDPLVAGQWAIEDRKKNTAMFNLRFGGSVHTYQNIENNVNDYVRTVTNILKQKGYDINQMTDPKQILTALQEGKTRYEGHSKDPMQYVDWTSNTPEYKYYANQGAR